MPELRPLLRRHRGVRHDRRMLDQALHAPQALGEREDLAALQKRGAPARPPFSSIVTMPPKPFICRCGERMLRMDSQPGIDHALDAGVALQASRATRIALLAMALHAQVAAS